MPYKTDYEISVDGRPLFVREVLPSAPATKHYLLFVHGNTFPSIPDFDLPMEGRSFVAFLAEKNICCCIYDSRGYGQSFKPPRKEANGLEERARDLAAVYRHLTDERGATNVSLFGLSTGCNIIAEFLRTSFEKPHHIANIIFSGPCYLFNDKAVAMNKQLGLLKVLRRLTGRGDNLYFSFKKRHLLKRLLHGEESFIDKRACEVFVRSALAPASFGRMRLRSPVLGFPSQHGRYIQGQRMFDVSTLTFPMLILRGERDRWCCEESASRLLADVPSKYVKLVTLPAVNHDMHLYQHPEVIFKEVSHFLQHEAKEAIR